MSSPTLGQGWMAGESSLFHLQSEVWDVGQSALRIGIAREMQKDCSSALFLRLCGGSPYATYCRNSLEFLRLLDFLWGFGLLIEDVETTLCHPEKRPHTGPISWFLDVFGLLWFVVFRFE